MSVSDYRTALVTGASKGIGFAVAQALVREGMNVTITARTESQVVEAAGRLSEEGPGRALGLACDVRDLEQQLEVARRTREEFGGIDVVIANAGVGGFTPIDELTPERWRAIVDTNLTGAYYTTHATVEDLKRAKGFLITIGSLAGTNFSPGGSAYNASKFGLLGFTQAAMLDLRRYDVRVSTIMPGSVATHFGGRPPTPEEAWKIQPEDVAAMVLYLLRVPARTLPSKVEVRPTRPPATR